MKLGELKMIIDATIEMRASASEEEVGVDIFKPGSVGGTPMANVKHAHSGFDWDHGKFIIVTDVKIAEVPDAIKMMEDWCKSQRRMFNRNNKG